jgi:hypothetical protein
MASFVICLELIRMKFSWFLMKEKKNYLRLTFPQITIIKQEGFQLTRKQSDIN